MALPQQARMPVPSKLSQGMKRIVVLAAILFLFFITASLAATKAWRNALFKEDKQLFKAWPRPSMKWYAA